MRLSIVVLIATAIATPTPDTVVPETFLTKTKGSPAWLLSPVAFSPKVRDSDSVNDALPEVDALEQPPSVVPMTSLLGMVRQSTGYTLDAIQADARTLSSIQRTINDLSEEQKHVRTSDLARDKTLSDNQVDAILAIQMMANKWNNQIRSGYVPREHGVVVTIRTVLRGIESKLETERSDVKSETDEMRIQAQQNRINSMYTNLNKLTKITSAPSKSPTTAPTTHSFRMSSVGIGCCRSSGWSVQEQGIETVEECKLRCLEDPNCVATEAENSPDLPVDSLNCRLYYADATSNSSADCTSLQGDAGQDQCYRKENTDFKWLKIKYPPTCPLSSPFLRCGQSAFSITKYICVPAGGGEEADTALCAHLTMPRDYAEDCISSNGCVEGYAEYAGHHCPSTDDETAMSFNDALLYGLNDLTLCKASCDEHKTCASFQFDPLKGVCHLYGSKCAGDKLLQGCTGCEASSIYVKHCACDSTSANFLVPEATLASSSEIMISESEVLSSGQSEQDSCIFASTIHPKPEYPTTEDPDEDERVVKENEEIEREKRDVALRDKETACTAPVSFTQKLDDLEAHRCLEGVFDYTVTTNYINIKHACDNAKSFLTAANEALARAEEVSSCASERSYYFWLRAQGQTFKNFHGCMEGKKVLTESRKYTQSLVSAENFKSN